MANIPTQSIGVCARCQQEDWRPFALAQPILAVSCRGCGAVEWLGVLGDEWAETVTWLTDGRSAA